MTSIEPPSTPEPTMSDRNDLLRELAAVRRKLDDLESEASTARGAMPDNLQVADDGRRNFEVVLKRLENVEQMAAETADTLRGVLQRLDA